MASQFRILVICTANICRSPAAQIFLQRNFSGKNVNVTSAGTHATEGFSADPMIQHLMLRRNCNKIRDHRSRLVLPHHLLDSHLILCMEHAQVSYIKSINYLTQGKCMMLGKWSEDQEIADPVGKAEEDYIRSLGDIEKFCNQWSHKITSMGLAE